MQYEPLTASTECFWHNSSSPGWKMCMMSVISSGDIICCKLAASSYTIHWSHYCCSSHPVTLTGPPGNVLLVLGSELVRHRPTSHCVVFTTTGCADVADEADAVLTWTRTWTLARNINYFGKAIYTSLTVLSSWLCFIRCHDFRIIDYSYRGLLNHNEQMLKKQGLKPMPTKLK